MPFLAPLALVIFGTFGWNAYAQPTFGAFDDPFLSIQLADSPVNGYYLSTDGTENIWQSLGSISGFSTTSADYWFTQQSTTGLTEGSNLYFTDERAQDAVGTILTDTTTIDLDYNDALNTITADYLGPVFDYLFPSNATTTNITFSGGITGDLTGNAGTATALAANGTNCSAGNYPLGVDASGNAENCTADANTTYTAGDHLTLTGTDFDVDDDFLLNTGDTGTGLYSFANSSTSLASFGYASSTRYFGAGLSTCHTGNALTWTDGIFGCEAVGGGSSFEYPFPGNATSTLLYFNGGIADTDSLELQADPEADHVSSQIILSVDGVAEVFLNSAGLSPSTNGGARLGASSNGWEDIFITSGGALDFGGGNLALTHSSGILSLSSNDTLDLGSSVLELPNGSSPTVDAVGEIAFDTTANQLIYATSTNASFPAVINPFVTMSAGHATSTWSGTTTQLMAPAPGAGRFTTAQCETTTGTVGVSLYDGTNRLNFFTASTTIGTITFGTNTTFTSGESIRVDFGTPASSPTQVACRFKYVYDRL